MAKLTNAQLLEALAVSEARTAELEAASIAPRHVPNGDFNIGISIPRADGSLQDLGVITASCLTYSKARGLSGLLAKRNGEFHSGDLSAEAALANIGQLVFTPQQAAGRDEDDEDFYSSAPKRKWEQGGSDKGNAGFEATTQPVRRATADVS